MPTFPLRFPTTSTFLYYTHEIETTCFTDANKSPQCRCAMKKDDITCQNGMWPLVPSNSKSL